ncbi:flavoprotein-like protein, partial [Baffinella frigidus]
MAEDFAVLVRGECPGSKVEVLDMSELGVGEWSPAPGEVTVFFVATWDDGEPCIDAQPFFAALRYATPAAAALFAARRFAVCGLGSSAYPVSYQAAAFSLSESLRALGALEICPVGEEDDVFPRLGYTSFSASVLPALSDPAPPIESP